MLKGLYPREFLNELNDGKRVLADIIQCNEIVELFIKEGIFFEPFFILNNSL